MFGLDRGEGKSDTRKYVEKWKSCMQEAYEIANKNAEKTAVKGKYQYDIHVP